MTKALTTSRTPAVPLANQAYAMANPMQWNDYSEHVWGLAASDSPDYNARGARRPSMMTAPLRPQHQAARSTPPQIVASLRYM